jgi:hypothetical protein
MVERVLVANRLGLLAVQRGFLGAAKGMSLNASAVMFTSRNGKDDATSTE